MTPLEMTNPNWCILKMPGVPASSIKPMVDPVLNTAGKVVAKHAQNFNLAAPALTIVSPGGVVIAATALAQSQIMAAAVVKNVSAITVG